jgi:PAS domain-containing protein
MAHFTKLAPDGEILDTTRRKLAELRLKESEEKFRAIFEHAADLVLLLNADSLASGGCSGASGK